MSFLLMTFAVMSNRILLDGVMLEKKAITLFLNPGITWSLPCIIPS